MAVAAKNLDVFENFYEISQGIIEKFYLQKYDGTKENLKDGVLEREIHGAMHVGRSQFYIPIINTIIKSNYSDLFSCIMQDLTEVLDLTEEQIIILIRYSVLLHDSGRKGEGRDVWEEQSEQNAKMFFIEKGFSELIADVFSYAIGYKDDKEGYKLTLENKIPENKIESVDYIRKLIFAADCLDIIRCVSDYNLSILLNYFDKFGKIEEIFSNLAINIHRIIRQQNDMLFGCKIKKNNADIMFDFEYNENLFSINEKTKIEHSDNVCSILLQYFINDDFFNKYFLEEKNVPLSKLYEASIGFSPLIHGTNSLALTLLPHTNYTMTCPIQLIEEFGLAPFGGEITQGGLSSAKSKCMPCYGRAFSAGGYNLSKIVAGYTSFDFDRDKLMGCLKWYLENGYRNSFSTINHFLVYAARARQIGFDFTDLQDDITKMLSQIKATEQFFYFILLLGRNIFVQKSEIVEFSYSERDELEDHLSFEKILYKLIRSNIDVKEIYYNPTYENLNKLLDIITYDYDKIYFLLISCNMEPCKFDANYHIYRFPENLRGYDICDLFENVATGRYTNFIFQLMHDGLLEYVKVLSRKSYVLEQILTSPLGFDLDIQNSSFMTNLFPILMVSNDDLKFYMMDFRTGEYRAKDSLKLGQDINMLVTDTEINRLKLIKYLELNNFYNISVVLIDELENSKTTRIKPDSYNTNVSWLFSKRILQHNLKEGGEIALDNLSLLSRAYVHSKLKI